MCAYKAALRHHDVMSPAATQTDVGGLLKSFFHHGNRCKFEKKLDENDLEVRTSAADGNLSLTTGLCVPVMHALVST
jgi:hypothetical protein